MACPEPHVHPSLQQSAARGASTPQDLLTSKGEMCILREGRLIADVTQPPMGADQHQCARQNTPSRLNCRIKVALNTLAQLKGHPVLVLLAHALSSSLSVICIGRLTAVLVARHPLAHGSDNLVAKRYLI